MFGNLLSDAEIIRMREVTDLEIEPFDVRRLKIAHYKLTPRTVWKLTTSAEGQPGRVQEHNFENDDRFVFAPDAYRLFEVEERVVLPDGVVANFVPVSEFALRGFSLVAGMLDAGYGKLGGETQKLFFGVKNLLGQPNSFDKSFGLAHMSLISLTGASLLRQELTKAELDRLAGRNPERWQRANDDGVFYPE